MRAHLTYSFLKFVHNFDLDQEKKIKYEIRKIKIKGFANRKNKKKKNTF